MILWLSSPLKNARPGTSEDKLVMAAAEAGGSDDVEAPPPSLDARTISSSDPRLNSVTTVGCYTLHTTGRESGMTPGPGLPDEPPKNGDVEVGAGPGTGAQLQQQQQQQPPSCDICLCEYQTGEVLAWCGAWNAGVAAGTQNRQSPSKRGGGCPHYFHRDCIVDWLRTGRTTCPSCRQEFLGPSAAPSARQSSHYSS